MGNLVKMDWYRLRKSKMFIISLIVTFVLNCAWIVGCHLLINFFKLEEINDKMDLSESISNPFSFGILMVLMFVSISTFAYADIANGYIKNIAGQVPNKGITVISKFIVIGIHNIIFFVAGSASIVIGNVISGTLIVDNQVFAGILTLLIKWLLSMAISSILLFVTTGLKSKTFASIVGVLLGSGFLFLVYMGLDSAISNIFKINDFNISDYAPDQLIREVNVAANTAVVNAIIVSVVCIVVFLTITVKVFNRKDVK
ncbi:MAG: ABC transporter permease [Ruminococcus sp.]|nr:ABC transporter permease [Ruminococcus sp.]